jgi:hypothetical protein
MDAAVWVIPLGALAGIALIIMLKYVVLPFVVNLQKAQLALVAAVAALAARTFAAPVL